MARRTPGRGGLFARKSIEETVEQTERSGFRRALGPIDLTSIGIAAIVGSGIFFLLGLEAQATGPAVVISLFVAGVGAVLAALAYAEFAGMIPGNGSAYAYAFSAFGSLPAFMIGWLVFNAFAVGNVAVAIGWSEFFVSAVQGVGWDFPQSLSAGPGDGGVANVPAAAAMALITLLCLPKIQESTRINNVLVALKLLVVLFVICFGVFFIRPGNYSPAMPGGLESVVSSAAVLFFAYIGFETISSTAEESKNPRRDLPLGIVLSIGVAALLYILMALVFTGMAPPGDEAGRAPIALAFSNEGHPWASGLITLGVLVALATVMYAFQIALSRVLHAMARDGFLPRRFEKLHPSTGTPWAITLLTGLATAAAAAWLPLGEVVDMAVLASIFVYLIVAAGVIVLKFLRPTARRSFRVHPVVPAAAIIVLLPLAFWGIPIIVHLAFGAWIGLGLALYGFYAYASSARRREETNSSLGDATAPHVDA